MARGHYSSQCFTKLMHDITDGKKVNDENEDVDMDLVFLDAITEQSFRSQQWRVQMLLNEVSEIDTGAEVTAI